MFERINKLRKLIRELKAGANLSDPERIEALDQFHGQLTAILGEEPTVLMSGRSSNDLAEVSLSNYLGWSLRTTHAAVYKNENAGFLCFASFGRSFPQIGRESALSRWVTEHGTLIRKELSLSGLSIQEAEELFKELDLLQADVISPILINGLLWGFIAAGPPFEGKELDIGVQLYLNLYGLNILGSFQRHQAGSTSPSKSWALQQDLALRETQELWSSLKPREGRLKLLILEEEQELTNDLNRFFNGWGFDVTGVSSEEAVLDYLKKQSPHLFLVDLHMKGQTPHKAIRATQILAPEAILFGTTSSHNYSFDTSHSQLGIHRFFIKPCRFAQLAKELFEAAISISLKGDPIPPIPTRPESYLIIEEDQEAAKALKGYFESLGARVWTTSSPLDSLALAELVFPRVVLLDLTLPPSLRNEFIRQFRLTSPKSRLIELTSSEEDPAHSDQESAFAPDAYCLKPVPLDQLHQLVSSVLQEPAYVR